MREDERKFWERHLQEIKYEMKETKKKGLHRDMIFWKRELRVCKKYLKEARENG